LFFGEPQFLYITQSYPNLPLERIDQTKRERREYLAGLIREAENSYKKQK